MVVYIKKSMLLIMVLLFSLHLQQHYYTIIYGLDNSSASYATNTTWDPFIPYGPHGVDSAIDVAAGYNSEGIPTLDTYSQ